MSSIEILGIASALLTLSAFIANEYGKLKAESFWYDFINFVSGVGLFVYAYDQGVVPFMLTNSVWAAVSGIDVVKYLLGHKGLKKRRK
ncbi:MAG: hypothetical protein G01um10148_637 [Parcubacteria group bacterium Gr01-1014_8]|nr:MAG: hypothetical protein G01um10148_637 [Parcubacteria group bacterium Gr01-1014_8]